MPITPSSGQMRLAELIGKIGTEIRVNHKYQRSGQIWPPRAKSFLVETVLRGMPIPRVLLHLVDNPTPPHHSDIIDGQQRCTILQEYRSNGFALTADVDDRRLHGKRWSELTSTRQQSFDDYMIPVDYYSGISQKQIRQVFRRLNYYTAPLNAAEQRHAQFDGELSRFVTAEAEAWHDVFETLRVFSPNQLRRKGDEQLMAELIDAMLRGVSTPTEKTLRDLFEDNERQFSSAANFRLRFAEVRDIVEDWTFLKRSPLRKHYHVFGLVLATMHTQSSLAALAADLGVKRSLLSFDEIKRNLLALDHAARTKAETGRYARFWSAAAEKTNVRPNRLVRTRYFYMAITGHHYPADELSAP